MSLADDVIELLHVEGPMDSEFIRIRLCVASEARFRAALFIAEQECRIERAGGVNSSIFRIPGDTRPLPIDPVYRSRRAAA